MGRQLRNATMARHNDRLVNLVTDVAAVDYFKQVA